MEKRKIGIMTFHYAHNYGAMLQAYALKTFLTDLGYDSQVINYIPEYMMMKYYHINRANIFLSFKRSIILDYIKRLRNIKRFNSFEKEELDIKGKKLTKEQLEMLTSKFDYLVFGSDQIWNTFITKNDYTYFGNFSDIKKVSYAASSGNAIDTKQYDEAVSKNLYSFIDISVREKNAQEYLKRKHNIKAEYVIDPVFLLKQDKWKELLSKNELPCIEKDYVFYYTIQKNDVLEKECNKFVENSKLNLLTAHGEMKKMNTNAEIVSGVGPIEFLQLINEAKYVFTNSFHALAFSIIFRKKVFICAHTETGNRVIDLLNEAGVMWDGQGIIELDFEKNSGNLSAFIENSKKFIKNALTM